MAPQQLRARLVAPTDVTVGDSAQLRLTVYNESSSETQLGLLAANGLAFDPVVRQGSDTIWQRSRNSVIISGALITRIPSRDSLSFTAVWRLTDSDGRAVGPGLYEVTAVLKDDVGHSIFGDSVRQVIKVTPR
jgi:hypothetical protein